MAVPRGDDHGRRTPLGGRDAKTRWFETACARAALAGRAGRAGPGVSAAGAVSEDDAAMALLRRAVATGYRSPDVFRTEDALDPLLDRAEFRLLMLDLAMPDEPFAAAR
jgi:hypothetical protein